MGTGRRRGTGSDRRAGGAVNRSCSPWGPLSPSGVPSATRGAGGGGCRWERERGVWSPGLRCPQAALRSLPHSTAARSSNGTGGARAAVRLQGPFRKHWVLVLSVPARRVRGVKHCKFWLGGGALVE